MYGGAGCRGWGGGAGSGEGSCATIRSMSRARVRRPHLQVAQAGRRLGAERWLGRARSPTAHHGRDCSGGARGSMTHMAHNSLRTRLHATAQAGRYKAMFRAQPHAPFFLGAAPPALILLVLLLAVVRGQAIRGAERQGAANDGASRKDEDALCRAGAARVRHPPCPTPTPDPRNYAPHGRAGLARGLTAGGPGRAGPAASPPAGAGSASECEQGEGQQARPCAMAQLQGVPALSGHLDGLWYQRGACSHARVQCTARAILYKIQASHRERTARLYHPHAPPTRCAGCAAEVAATVFSNWGISSLTHPC